MNELKLYNVNSSYVDQHYRVEKHHGKHNKPYLGIILKINNIHYFIPLSSPKSKHKHMYESLTYQHYGLLYHKLNICSLTRVVWKSRNFILFLVKNIHEKLRISSFLAI